MPTVTATGLGPTLGIDFLSVLFFDPDVTPLLATPDVVGGVSTYTFVDITFDTTVPS